MTNDNSTDGTTSPDAWRGDLLDRDALLARWERSETWWYTHKKKGVEFPLHPLLDKVSLQAVLLWETVPVLEAHFPGQVVSVTACSNGDVSATLSFPAPTPPERDCAPPPDPTAPRQPGRKRKGESR